MQNYVVTSSNNNSPFGLQLTECASSPYASILHSFALHFRGSFGRPIAEGNEQKNKIASIFNHFRFLALEGDRFLRRSASLPFERQKTN